MTAMVSARALWWDDPEVCTCACPDEDYPCPHDTFGGWAESLSIGELNGWSYITDRYVLLPIARLGELPIGYATKLNLSPIPSQALDGFAGWLDSRVLSEPSDRVFASWLIDPIEAAGLVVRPLDGRVDVHGICDPDPLTMIGLVIPVARSRATPGSEGMRAAVA